jgi:DNA oxidative demethylase
MQIPMTDKAHLMIDYRDYLAPEHGAFILRGFALRYGEELQRGLAELQKIAS